MADATDYPPLSRGKKLAFTAFTVVFVFALLEGVLRLTGVGEECPSRYTNEELWACDPILEFKLKPELNVNGWPLNKAGFRTREFTSKRPGVYRVLSLGDSCTFGIINREMFEYIPVPYPARLEQFVLERAGRDQVEVFNAAIPGYNSFHGLMLMKTKLRNLDPDLVTVRFGWNDHLMAQAARSERAFSEPDNRIVREAQDLLLHTAMYPFVRRMELEFQAWRAPKWKPTAMDMPTVWKPSVSLEQYKQNLRRITELARGRGAAVWLLTSPHAFVTDENRGHYEKFPNRPSARMMLNFNAIPSYERLIEIHESYNDATREVGAELGVPVVDMDALYKQHASEHLYSSYDIPHPLQQGHDLEAEALYARLVASGVVRPQPLLAADGS